jgi:hypothetical protein
MRDPKNAVRVRVKYICIAGLTINEASTFKFSGIGVNTVHTFHPS